MNTLNLPYGDMALGDLARDIPGATAIFHNHNLNFCCGGKQTLREAAGLSKLDPELIVAELESLSAALEDGSGLDDASDATLIEYILTRYHDVHRQQLPELIRLAARVERVHGGHPLCPAGLTNHLEQMQEELVEHMRREEEILFPMIARGMRGAALSPIAMMRSQHEEHGDALTAIDRFTRNATPPDDACTTWRALYLGLKTLRKDLMNHIHLENNILFHRLDA